MLSFVGLSWEVPVGPMYDDIILAVLSCVALFILIEAVVHLVS